MDSTNNIEGCFTRFKTDDFHERKKIMRIRTKDNGYLQEITNSLQLAASNSSQDDVKGIIEGLYLQEITTKQAEILFQQIQKQNAIDRFINHFKNFQRLGFTPYFLFCIVAVQAVA
jgi:hypothetical protein